MRHVSLTLVIAALCLPLVIACAQDQPQPEEPALDWPNYQGPGRNSISNETGINKDWTANPPQVLWQVPMHDGGFAGPCSTGGKVYILDRGKAGTVVRALSLETGAELWTYGYADSQGENYGYERSTPAVSEGKLYITGRLGQLICLDAETGAKVWSRNLADELGARAPIWLFSASPVIDGDRVVVVVGSEKGNLATFNKDTGELIWIGGGADISSYCTPAIATILDRKQYVVVTGESIIGVAADSGEQLWRIPWETEYSINGATPIVEGDFVLISSGYKHGSALFEITANGPVSYWESTDLAPKFNSAVYVDSYVYGISESGNLVCLSPQNGVVAWREGGFEWGGLVAVDGTLIAMNGKAGDVVMLAADPTGYRELGRINPLPNGDQYWTAPIVADGKLIVRSKAGLACLNLK